MFSQADTKVIILIMLMAIIVAVAGALAYWYILTRDPYPEGTYEVLIDDQLILVESDPNSQIKLVSTPVPEGAVSEEIVQDQQEGGEETSTTEETGDGGEAAATPEGSTDTVDTQPTPESGTGEGSAQTVQQQPQPTPPPPTAVPRPPQVIIENYPVPPGESLYGITTKRNTTIALMARYGISAAEVIPGTTIPLPVANPAYCSGSFPYVVREEDTLSIIAVKCNTTVQNLKQINGFGDNYRLDVTGVICVPNPP